MQSNKHLGQQESFAHLASSEQKSFLWQTTRSTGKSHSVRGPASALKNYLQRLVGT